MGCRAPLLGALLLGCSSGAERTAGPTPEIAIELVRGSLSEGELGAARQHLRQAARRLPENPALMTWSALMSQMQWREEESLQVMLELHARGDFGDFGEAEVMGRIGELMFRAGQYAESIPYLYAGQAGVREDQRKALTELARDLPYVRTEPRQLAVAMPMIEGELPELLCSFGEIERPFVLDTGASFTTLGESLATELGVRDLVSLGEIVDGTGRGFPASFGVLPSFSLGSVQLGDQPVLVVADEQLALRDRLGGSEAGSRGLVGFDILGRFRVTFDPEQRSVIFELPRGLGEDQSVECVAFDGRCLVPVLFEGRQLWFVLDTGASHSSLTGEGLAAIPGGEQRARESTRRIYTPAGILRAVREVEGASIRVDRVRFVVDLPVVPRESAPLFPVHGVLGADFVMRCRTTFDGGRIRFVAL